MRILSNKTQNGIKNDEQVLDLVIDGRLPRTVLLRSAVMVVKAWCSTSPVSVYACTLKSLVLKEWFSTSSLPTLTLSSYRFTASLLESIIPQHRSYNGH